MNKILENRNKFKIKEDTTLYLDSDAFIDVDASCKVIIYHLVVNKDINVTININHEMVEVEYHFSIINYSDHNFNINVYHNKNNTISNIFNHGVNVFNEKLSFNVNGYVSKNLDEVVCNQENQIINISDGKSTICPNLYIDSYNAISNHSAYIGKFDKDAVFYMMSRGISLDLVNKILVKGFLIPSGVLDDEVKDFLLEIDKI